MGQISLVRFNKLSNSMTWEGGVGDLQMHWLSTKLYLFFKFFIPILFWVRIFTFFNIWTNGKKKSLSHYSTCQKSKKRKLKKNIWKLIMWIKDPLQINVLQLYLYTSNTTNFLCCVYANNSEFNNLLTDTVEIESSQQLDQGEINLFLY